jgi:hypothetical protein
VVLSEDKGNFKFGKAAMPDEPRAEIDTLVPEAEGRAERALHRDRRPHRRVGNAETATTVSACSAPRT